MTYMIRVGGTVVENFLEMGDEITGLDDTFGEIIEKLKESPDAGPISITLVISNDFEHDEEEEDGDIEESEDEESDDKTTTETKE